MSNGPWCATCHRPSNIIFDEWDYFKNFLVLKTLKIYKSDMCHQAIHPIIKHASHMN
jgi:hypothetical protein